MIFYGIKFSSVSKLVIQWFYTLYHDSCVKITFWIFFFLIFHVIFMPKNTALKLHTTTSAVGLQLNCRHNSKLRFNVVSTCRNHPDHCQKSVGHVQMRMAMWNLVHLQCIEIILSLSTQRLFVCARSKDKAPDKAVILAILLKINFWMCTTIISPRTICMV